MTLSTNGFNTFDTVRWRCSFQYVAAPGVTTEWVEQFPVDVLLQGGQYKVDANVKTDYNDPANGSDYLEVEILDQDDNVLAKFIDREYVEPSEKEELTDESVAQLPTAYKVRTRYVSRGQTAVNLRMRFYLRK